MERPLCIKGKVTTGQGRGSYFVRIYRTRLRNLVGFDPFIGTLNLKVNPEEAAVFLKNMQEVMLPGFDEDGKSYAALETYNVKVFDLDAVIVKPCLSDRDPSIIELIAAVDLREMFNIKDGDELEVKYEKQ
ncbi:CTP-dependent riboflavin kinase [Candidatus Woesearchaeota archaeon]|nr:CTP-dependent riboflavin kinase [Candidatus Woesearchaeota archaeon]